MRHLLSRAGLLALLAVGAVSTGCKTHYIPNTSVEDTDLNRRVIEFAELYRRAIERGNVGRLADMADERYYEDGGNADASDDMDRAGLNAYLKAVFAHAEGVRYEIRYRTVGQGRNGSLYLDYTYTATYKVPTKDGLAWKRTVADNRLELVPSGESFKILSGM